MYKNEGNFPVDIVFCGHFYINKSTDKLSFMPIKKSDISSWIFIPDQD